VPAPGNSAPKVFAPLGAMQRLVVSQLFLAEKTNGQFKESQLPSQPRLQFGRNRAVTGDLEEQHDEVSTDRGRCDLVAGWNFARDGTK
jgi:hypothetical protein